MFSVFNFQLNKLYLNISLIVIIVYRCETLYPKTQPESSGPWMHRPMKHGDSNDMH